MLSEDTIDNLIQPIIDRQIKINNYVIGVMADRIKEIGTLTPSDLLNLQMLIKSGADINKIKQMLAKLTELQVRDITNLIDSIAKDSYKDMKFYFDYKGFEYIPYKENKALQNIVKSIATQTANTYVNLSKASAFMLRDLKNPATLIPTSISRTYQTVIDEAIQLSSTVGVDYNTAMQRTLKQLIDSGIRSVSYNTETGKIYTQRLDTAVRRNILDGIRAINQGVQDEVGKQFEADGKEITVHAYPAPDHAPVQGHQFTNAEFDKMQLAENFIDVQGRHYTGFERAIGTLNCRHFTFSIIVGVSPQNYTDEQLQDILDKNEKGYTLPNGKHLTMYQCTQYQRRLETTIRQLKDGQIASKKAGNLNLAKEYQTKVNSKTAEYMQFSNACGLSPKLDKIKVIGYKSIK